MRAAGLIKTSCCHPVDNSFHSGCPIQMTVICGTSTFKQYIGLTNHYTGVFLAENGLRMAITLPLKEFRTSPFGTLVQGPLSQSSTSVQPSSVADCAFLQIDDASLRLIGAELDYGTLKLLY